MQISKHTFLVTGAASGLGAGTARMLVGAGGNVIMAGPMNMPRWYGT